jgi:hypothetical protein
MNAAKPITAAAALMGFASLNPSYNAAEVLSWLANEVALKSNAMTIGK